MKDLTLGELLTVIDIGDSVMCDWCNQEFDGSNEQGGFMFGTYATCPRCAPQMERTAIAADDAHMIRSRCPPGMSFHDWIMQLRGGNNTITVHRLNPTE